MAVTDRHATPGHGHDGQTLTVSLGTPARLCTVIVGAPSLTGALKRGPRSESRPEPTITVSVGDDNRGASRLTAQLKGGP